MKLQSNNIKYVSTLVFVIFLATLAGLQWFGASKDVDQYQFFFNDISDDYTGRFEFLFVAVTLFLKAVTDNFSMYIFFLVLISLSIKTYIISRFGLLLFSFTGYLLILFPLHELTQYRISLALAVMYIAFYLKHKGGSNLVALVLFFCSIFLHYSTVAYLPFLLFWRYLNNLKAFLYILIFLLVLLFLKQQVTLYAFDLNSTLLANDALQPNIFSVRNILYMTVLTLGYFNWKDIPLNVKPFWFVSLYGFVLWGLFYDLPVFAHRLFEMTLFSYFIWISFLRGLSLRGAQILILMLSAYSTYKNIYVDQMFS